MPTDKSSARKHGAKATGKAPKLASGKGAQLSKGLQVPNPQVPSGFEDLDEGTLLSISIDAPVQLTPPSRNDPLVPESSPTPLSKMRVSNEVMAATLERLGFGPPNDLSDITLPSPTPANSEVSMGASSHEEKVPTAEGIVPTMEAPYTDDSDAYGQINRLFQQIAQKTGHSANTLILEWALLHAHTDMVKREITRSRTITAHQQAFEEEVNKAINMGTGLADMGIDFMFVMVGQNVTKDVSLGKVWSSAGLQGMFNDLSLSDDEILAAARMRSNSIMWSHFYKKYKQDRAKPPVENGDETRAGFSATEISSYIAKQSAAAASAFVKAPGKKRRIKIPAEGSSTLLVPKQDGPSNSLTSSSSDSGS